MYRENGCNITVYIAVIDQYGKCEVIEKLLSQYWDRQEYEIRWIVHSFFSVWGIIEDFKSLVKYLYHESNGHYVLLHIAINFLERTANTVKYKKTKFMLGIHT